jgi:hypothetical protein
MTQLLIATSTEQSSSGSRSIGACLNSTFASFDQLLLGIAEGRRVRHRIWVARAAVGLRGNLGVAPPRRAFAFLRGFHR